MEWYFRVLAKYAVFRGRARRKEYWFYILFNVIFSIILAIVDMSMDTFDPKTGVGLFGTIYAAALILPSMAVTVRRLHDIGRSGWWMLIPIVPILGAILIFAFLVQDSDPGENRFGPNPKLRRA